MSRQTLIDYAVTHLKNYNFVFWRQAKTNFPELAGILPNGKFFAIEITTNDEILSGEKIEWITKLNHNGAIALILKNKKEIKEFIESASKLKK